MNTRLQVEHPITEMVLGLDLVQWQLRVAAGEPLPWRQEDLRPRGHALEVRVYAEDPARDFLPSTGRLLYVAEPQGPGVRVDSGVRPGLEVTPHYDPLLAKIIVHAENRAAALARMRAALERTAYHGVVTNVAFLLQVLEHPDFRAGRYHTRWVDEVLRAPAPQDHLPLAALAALALAERLPAAGSGAATGPTPAAGRPDPWAALQGWYPSAGANQEGAA